MVMTNTLILEYAGRGLCVFHATDEHLKKLTERVVALKVKGNDFANAATRLMDRSADPAKVDRADLDMTILMALNQIGGADLDDPHVQEYSRVKSSLQAWSVTMTGTSSISIFLPAMIQQCS